MASDSDIRELSLPAAVTVSSSMLVRVALSLMRARRVEVVVVLDDSGAVVGLATWAELMARSRVNFDAPVSTVAIHRLREVPPGTSVREAMRELARPDVAGLVVRRACGGCSLLTQRGLLEDDEARLKVEQAMAASGPADGTEFALH